MGFNITIKEKIARVIGDYFTTNEIVNVFNDANIPTDKSLYAKWRITLDAFSKMSDPGAGILHVLEVLCHPLMFREEEIRRNFINALNKILSYEAIQIQIKANRVKIVSMSRDTRYELSKPTPATMTSTDHVVEAINFFKNEYNKARISGLTYEYPLGENANSDTVENGHDGYEESLKAIEQLKDVGFITEYKIEVKDEGAEIYWDYAVCKIDESKITQKEEPRATDEGVQNLTQKVIHEHTHRFENSIQEKSVELSHKVEITKIPELQVRNVENNTIVKGKRRAPAMELSLPEPVQWKKVVFKIKEGRQEVEIFYDSSHVITADYRQLHFFVGKKQQKPDRQWGFLCAISTLSATDIQQATAENMRRMITENKTLSANNVQQVKKLLVERLKELFKTTDDPFYNEREYYYPKFTILPEPALRQEEIRSQGGRLNENRDYEDDGEKTL